MGQNLNFRYSEQKVHFSLSIILHPTAQSSTPLFSMTAHDVQEASKQETYKPQTVEWSVIMKLVPFSLKKTSTSG